MTYKQALDDMHTQPEHFKAKIAKNPIYTVVSYRNPFSISNTTIFLKSFYWQNKRYYPKQKILRKFSKILYNVLKLTKINWEGEFIYYNKNKKYVVKFNERNRQFYSICDPASRVWGSEPESIALIGILVGAGNQETFYDVGSNWGIYALFIASINDNTDIYAFEPIPESYKDLVSTIKQVNLQNQVSTYQLALSDKEGTSYMQLSDMLASGSATITNNKKGISVSTNKIDNLEIPPPSIIKIDVEGHEDKVLEGGIKKINQYKPFILFENILNFDSPNTTIRPLKILKDLGYVFFQPAVLLNNEESELFSIGYGDFDKLAASGVDYMKIILYPFSINQRFLLRKLINIFACPEIKLNYLQSIFSNSLIEEKI